MDNELIGSTAQEMPSATYEKLDDATLRPLVRKVVRTHDMTTFTPRMMFFEVSKLLNCPVEHISGIPEVRALVKAIAKELVSCS